MEGLILLVTVAAALVVGYFVNRWLVLRGQSKHQRGGRHRK